MPAGVTRHVCWCHQTCVLPSVQRLISPSRSVSPPLCPPPHPRQVRKAYKVYKLGGVLSEILYSPAAFGLDMSVKNMPKPRSRISAQVGRCAQAAAAAASVALAVPSVSHTLPDMPAYGARCVRNGCLRVAMCAVAAVVQSLCVCGELVYKYDWVHCGTHQLHCEQWLELACLPPSGLRCACWAARCTSWGASWRWAARRSRWTTCGA